METLGRWAGVAENVGDELTFIVVSDATGQGMFRSDLRIATDPNAPNFRAETIAADKLQRDTSGDKDPGRVASVFSPINQDSPTNDEKVYPYPAEEMVGQTFMQEDPTNGYIIRTEIVRMLKKGAEDTTQQIKFLAEPKNGTQSVESIMNYTDLCDIVQAQVQAMEDGTDDDLPTSTSS
jgi:hypothetical protein